MTVIEYRQKLYDRIGQVGGGWAEGLKEAFKLSEGLYDTYVKKDEHRTFMTNRQLAEMLAKGYGQVTVLPTDQDGDYATFETHWTYFDEEGGGDNDEVFPNVRIRAWGSEAWSEPTTSLYNSWKMGTLVSIKED